MTQVTIPKEQMRAMMLMMLEGMGPEDIMDMMSQMMPKMMSVMAKADPEKMKAAMSRMMPMMMSMGPGGMMETMHEVMPGMMNECLGPMTKEERQKMFSFCRGMISEMETRFL